MWSAGLGLQTLPFGFGWNVSHDIPARILRATRTHTKCIYQPISAREYLGFNIGEATFIGTSSESYLLMPTYVA